MARLTWAGNLRAQAQYEAVKKPKPKKRKAKKDRKKPVRFAKPSYHAYIQSKAWKARRVQKLKNAGFRCARCQSGSSLHVHHLTYERLGREKDSDLEVLCENCHADHHLAEVFGVSVETLNEFGERLINKSG